MFLRQHKQQTQIGVVLRGWGETREEIFYITGLIFNPQLHSKYVRYTSSLNANVQRSNPLSQIITYVTLKLVENTTNKCFWLRVLMPIKKHRDTHPHNIKLPPLLPYHSPPLGKSPTHVSMSFELQLNMLLQFGHNLLKIKSDLAGGPTVLIGSTCRLACPHLKAPLVLEFHINVTCSLFPNSTQAHSFQLNHAGHQ